MQRPFRQSTLQLNKTGFSVTVLAVFAFTLWILHTTPSDISTGVIQSSLISPPKAHWPGWGGIKHLVVFGDSYTSTGFQTNGAQPSEANPLGNPDYPGDTSANGPNWVDFLTTTYNRTFVKTLNFAYGGATVDGDLIRQFVPMIHSMKDQVRNDFLPNYATPPAHFDWKPRDTLFASFFGINDVNNAYQDGMSDRLATDIEEYACFIDEVYQSGARNFLFMNVPPFDRSPLVIGHGQKAMMDEDRLINEFNANVTRIAKNLTDSYHDVTAFVFDTHRVYTQVLDDPCSHKESCMVQNTTDYCIDYQPGTPEWYSFSPKCSIPVDQYFWLNPLHPTFRIQNVTAKVVAQELSRGGTGVAESRPSALPKPSEQPY